MLTKFQTHVIKSVPIVLSSLLCCTLKFEITTPTERLYLTYLRL